MKPAVKHALRLGLTVLILVMLVLFARKVNWHATWAGIRTASLPLLVVAALLNILSIVVKAIRWWVFLRPVGSPSFWLALKATFAGAGLNNVLVANGGEAARVVFVSRSAHVPSATVLATLALERLFELVGYVTMLSLAVTFLDLPHTLERVKPFAIATLVGMFALLAWLIRRPTVVAELTGPMRTSWHGRIRDYFGRLGRTIGAVSSVPRFAAALVLSVIAWALQVATYQVTAVAANFPMPLVATIAALIAVNLGFALRATPGNVGLFQAAYAATAVAFGFDRDQAIAVAFLIQAQQILPVTLLGVGLAPEFIFSKGRKRDGAAGAVDPVAELARGDRATD
jgi:uncharacterized protein (TIRG00374 family)